jgi:hypothetical protein
VVGDTTPEKLGAILRDNPKGVLLNRDEIAGWLGSFGRYSSAGGGERAMWLEAYGGRAYSIDRQKSPEPIIIPHLTVSILGGVQPDKLRLITGGEDDGFASPLPVVLARAGQWLSPRPCSGRRDSTGRGPETPACSWHVKGGGWGFAAEPCATE